MNFLGQSVLTHASNQVIITLQKQNMKTVSQQIQDRVQNVRKTQSGNLVFSKKWDYVQWAGLFIATLLLEPVLCAVLRTADCG